MGVLPVAHTLHLLGQEPRMGLELELDIVGCIVVVDTAAGHTVVEDIVAAHLCSGHSLDLADHNLVDMASSSFG